MVQIAKGLRLLKARHFICWPVSPPIWQPAELKARRFLMADPSNRWTSEEDALFRNMVEASASPEMIASRLNRSI